MNYQEAYDWLTNQEGWTEEKICNFLNSEGALELIRIAEECGLPF